MQCFQCGKQFADGAPYCPKCGMPVNMSTTNQFAGAQQAYQQGQPYGQPYGSNQPLSKKEFLNHPNLSKVKGNISYSSFTLYVCAAISLIVNLFAGNLFIFVDVLLVVGLSLGVQLAQSRVCAILIFIYSFINMIYMKINTGYNVGRLIMIAAVYALIATFQFQSAWKKYKRNGTLPTPK